MTEPAKFTWSLYGASIGLFVALTDYFIGWRDVSFAPWVGAGIYENIGMFVSSTFGAATIGLIAGAVRDAIARRTDKMS